MGSGTVRVELVSLLANAVRGLRIWVWDSCSSLVACFMALRIGSPRCRACTDILMGSRGPFDLRPKVRPIACMLAELSISDLVRANRREQVLLSRSDDVVTCLDLEQVEDAVVAVIVVVVPLMLRRLRHLRSLMTGAVAGAVGGSCFSSRLSAAVEA